MASSAPKITHCAACGRSSPIYQCADCRHFYMTVNTNIALLQIYCSKVCLEAGSNSHASLCPLRMQMFHTALLLRDIYLLVRKITFDLDVVAIDHEVDEGVYRIKHRPLEGGKILAAYPDHLCMTSEKEKALLGHNGGTMAIVVFGALLEKLLTGAVMAYCLGIGHGRGVMELKTTLAKPKTVEIPVEITVKKGHAPIASSQASHSVFRIHFIDDVTYTIDLTSPNPLMLWKRYEEEFVIQHSPLEKFNPKAGFTQPAMPLGTTPAYLAGSEQDAEGLENVIARRVKAEMLSQVRDEMERCVGVWEQKHGRELKNFLRSTDYCDDRVGERAFSAMKKELVGLVGAGVAALVKKGKLEMGWSYQESYDELAERLGIVSFRSDEEVE